MKKLLFLSTFTLGLLPSCALLNKETNKTSKDNSQESDTSDVKKVANNQTQNKNSLSPVRTDRLPTTSTNSATSYKPEPTHQPYQPVGEFAEPANALAPASDSDIERNSAPISSSASSTISPPTPE